MKKAIVGTVVGGLLLAGGAFMTLNDEPVTPISSPMGGEQTTVVNSTPIIPSEGFDATKDRIEDRTEAIKNHIQDCNNSFKSEFGYSTSEYELYWDFEGGYNEERMLQDVEGEICRIKAYKKGELVQTKVFNLK